MPSSRFPLRVDTPAYHQSTPCAASLLLHPLRSAGTTNANTRHVQGIGMLAAVIKELEDNPYEPSINRSGVYYTLLQCRAEHDPGLSPRLRTLIAQSRTDDEALHALEEHLAETDKL